MRRINIIAILPILCIFAGCGTSQHHGIIRDGGELWGQDGKHIVVEGTVAKEIWQHMMAPTRTHPHETYFDIGKQQVVIYSRDAIACTGTVRVEGTAVKIEGSSKNPRRKETCTEYHIMADAWKCLN
jgi:hypothetical protein